MPNLINDPRVYLSSGYFNENLNFNERTFSLYPISSDKGNNNNMLVQEDIFDNIKNYNVSKSSTLGMQAYNLRPNAILPLWSVTNDSDSSAPLIITYEIYRYPIQPVFSEYYDTTILEGYCIERITVPVNISDNALVLISASPTVQAVAEHFATNNNFLEELAETLSAIDNRPYTVQLKVINNFYLLVDSEEFFEIYVRNFDVIELPDKTRIIGDLAYNTKYLADIESYFNHLIRHIHLNDSTADIQRHHKEYVHSNETFETRTSGMLAFANAAEIESPVKDTLGRYNSYLSKAKICTSKTVHTYFDLIQRLGFDLLYKSRFFIEDFYADCASVFHNALEASPTKSKMKVSFANLSSRDLVITKLNSRKTALAPAELNVLSLKERIRLFATMIKYQLPTANTDKFNLMYDKDSIYKPFLYRVSCNNYFHKALYVPNATEGELREIAMNFDYPVSENMGIIRDINSYYHGGLLETSVATIATKYYSSIVDSPYVIRDTIVYTPNYPIIAACCNLNLQAYIRNIKILFNKDLSIDLSGHSHICDSFIDTESESGYTKKEFCGVLTPKNLSALQCGLDPFSPRAVKLKERFIGVLTRDKNKRKYLEKIDNIYYHTKNDISFPTHPYDTCDSLDKYGDLNHICNFLYMLDPIRCLRSNYFYQYPQDNHSISSNVNDVIGFGADGNITYKTTYTTKVTDKHFQPIRIAPLGFSVTNNNHIVFPTVGGLIDLGELSEDNLPLINATDVRYDAVSQLVEKFTLGTEEG